MTWHLLFFAAAFYCIYECFTVAQRVDGDLGTSFVALAAPRLLLLLQLCCSFEL